MPLLVDPSNMSGLMTGQMSMVVQNVYMIGLYNTIDYFFSGFIAAKLPISLTGGIFSLSHHCLASLIVFPGFKNMLHAGIALFDLELTYVSSSSWYLLIFSGTLPSIDWQ